MQRIHNFIFFLNYLSSVAYAIRRLDQIPIERQRELLNELYRTETPEDTPNPKQTVGRDGNHGEIRNNGRERDEREHSSLPTPEDHLVTSLPLLNPDSFTTRHYAGHLPASDDNDKKLFYWLFEANSTAASSSSHDESEVPLLIWLNGGPGCSSMDGLFIETGPFRLVPPPSDTGDGTGGPDDDKWSIDINPNSWHNAPAHLLFIDQPVGTGLSFTRTGKYCKNDREINIDFYHFLQNFLTVYAEWFLNADSRTMSRPLYFSGESHAGHYIPSMMDYILQRNDNATIRIDLGGAAIGNGWIEPYHQYAVSDYAYSIGLIDAAQREAFLPQEHECHSDLSSGMYNSGRCRTLFDKVVDEGYGRSSSTVVNPYDTRKWEVKHAKRFFPPGYTDIEAFLGGYRKYQNSRYPNSINGIKYEQVMEALHASESIAANQRYMECTDEPYFALVHQDGLGVTEELVRVLEHKDAPRMLFFNGMTDLVCHHMGNELTLLKLPWRHRKEWTVADRYAWNLDIHSRAPEGYMKEFKNLMFLKIPGSGHMVPLDLPVVSLHMIRTFLYSHSFGSHKQELKSTIPGDNVGNVSIEFGDGDTGKNCDGSSSLFQLSSAIIGLLVGIVVSCISLTIQQRQKGGIHSNEVETIHETELVTKGFKPYKDEPGSGSNQEHETSSSAII